MKRIINFHSQLGNLRIDDTVLRNGRDRAHDLNLHLKPHQRMILTKSLLRYQSFQRLIQYNNLEIFVRGNTWGNSRHVSQLLWIRLSDSCNWWSASNTTGQDLVVIDPAHNNGRTRREYEKAWFNGGNEIDPGKKIILMTFTDACPEAWSRIKEWRRLNLALEINEPRTWYAWLNPGLYISPSKLRITWLPLKRCLLNTYASRLKSGSVGANTVIIHQEVNRSKAKITKNRRQD